MKQFVAIFAFMALGAVASFAQPVMTFKQTTVDYGTVEKGSEPLRKFEFTNTGTEPLIIKNAKGSCGCTVPTYPKEPIMPGESNVIEVRYDTNRVGTINKTVTLTTNEPNDTKILTIKGEVKDSGSAPAVAPATGGLKSNN